MDEIGSGPGPENGNSFVFPRQKKWNFAMAFELGLAEHNYIISNCTVDNIVALLKAIAVTV